MASLSFSLLQLFSSGRGRSMFTVFSILGKLLCKNNNCNSFHLQIVCSKLIIDCYLHLVYLRSVIDPTIARLKHSPRVWLLDAQIGKGGSAPQIMFVLLLEPDQHQFGSCCSRLKGSGRIWYRHWPLTSLPDPTSFHFPSGSRSSRFSKQHALST